MITLGLAALLPAGRAEGPLNEETVLPGEAIEVRTDLVYENKAALAAAVSSLTLDLYLPPVAPEARKTRPLIILIHGGGFFGGDKAQCRAQAMAYARQGFAAASINYRLVPRPWRDASPENFITAATQAVVDGMDAIRFLKLHAAEYGYDPDRIATVGFSAGGWISLINAIEPDRFNGDAGSIPVVSSRVAVAAASGVSLADNATCRRLRDQLLTFDRDDTPAMLFHAETVDSVTTATWADAEHLAQLIRASGNYCGLYPQPGSKHTDDLSPVGRHWEAIRTFLMAELRLKMMPGSVRDNLQGRPGTR